MSVIFEIALLHYQQHSAGVDRLPFGDGDVAHTAIASRAQFVLHFHRFDDNQALAGLHIVAGFDEHAHDFARHRRNEALRPHRVRGRAVFLPTPERARRADLHRDGEAVEMHVEVTGRPAFAKATAGGLPSPSA